MKKKEICEYCNDEYTPTRRGAQKYCSGSCRSLSWRDKQRVEEPKKNIEEPICEVSQENKTENKPEKMSLAGVGNAATGAAVVELAKTLLTSAENKPATKKDIQELKTLIKARYLPINNWNKDIYGRFPYYDVETGNVVYLKS